MLGGRLAIQPEIEIGVRGGKTTEGVFFGHPNVSPPQFRISRLVNYTRSFDGNLWCDAGQNVWLQ